MKIISNYKDYYDYLVGIYGVDQKVVYDRRFSGNPFDQSTFVGHLFVLGKHYLVMPQKGALPIIALSELIAFYKKMSKDDSDRVQVFKPDAIKFSRIIPAKEMYLGLTEFLSYKEPELKTKPEDMTRFESKGFSKKTSFRKM